MKKVIATAVMAMFIGHGLAQDGGNKAIKKQEKMERRSSQVQTAEHKGKDKKAQRKINKMEKKESKMNRKADKDK